MKPLPRLAMAMPAPQTTMAIASETAVSQMS
jgi:hypothetical protein